MNLGDVAALLLMATGDHWNGHRSACSSVETRRSKRDDVQRSVGIARSRAVQAVLGALGFASRPTAAHNAAQRITDAAGTT